MARRDDRPGNESQQLETIMRGILRRLTALLRLAAPATAFVLGPTPAGWACTSLFSTPEATKFSQISSEYPASMTWVLQPYIRGGKFNIGLSGKFHLLERGGCTSIGRDALAPYLSRGYLAFTLNNSVVSEGDDWDYSGRNFVIVQVKLTYNEGNEETMISAFRNSKPKEKIWERDKNEIDRYRLRQLNMDINGWNAASKLPTISEADKIFNGMLHAQAIGGTSSTWDFKDKLIVPKSENVSVLSNMFFSIALVDAKDGQGGSGVPFFIYVNDEAHLKEIRLKVISEVPALNFVSNIVVE